MKKYDLVQLVTRSDTVGGVHNHIIDLVLYTNSKNLKTLILVGDSSEKKFLKKLKGLKIDFQIIKNLKVKVDLKYDLKALFELIFVLKKIKPKIICIHSSKSGILGRIAGFILKIPTIFTIHGWSFSIKTNIFIRIFYLLLEYLLQFISKEIITDSFNDKKLAKKMGFKISRITAIPNCSAFPDQPSKKVKNNTNDNISFLTIARLDYQKDYESLFLGLSQLPKDLNWQLVYVGDGLLSSKAKKLAKYLSIDHKVEFVGFKIDLQKFYQNADVYILSSNWEGLPITLLDAMNFSLPIVTTNVGGCSDVVSHGYNGYLVPIKSPEHMKLFLKHLSQNKSLIYEFGTKSKLLYKKLFNKKLFNEKTFEVYQKYLIKN